MTTCDYHDEDGWLPLMPPAEANDDQRDAMDVAGITVPMLFARELVACPCAPEYAFNDDLALPWVAVDVISPPDR